MSITREEVLENLSYDPTTGIFRWAKARQKIQVGDIAGSIENGYVRIRLNLRKYAAHRLAFLFMTGKLPRVVDHINGNPSDNRWCNLRSVSQKENLRNRKPRKTKSGVVGVTREAGRWRARIHTDSGRVNIGVYDTFADAVAARKKAELKYGYFQ